MLRCGVTETNFVNYLKQFQLIVSKIPWKHVTSTTNPIKQHLDHIFSIYIDVRMMKKQDIDHLVQFLEKHKFNSQVRNLIVGVIICELDNANTYEHDKLKQGLVRQHVFRCIS